MNICQVRQNIESCLGWQGETTGFPRGFKERLREGPNEAHAHEGEVTLPFDLSQGASNQLTKDSYVDP